MTRSIAGPPFHKLARQCDYRVSRSSLPAQHLPVCCGATLGQSGLRRNSSLSTPIHRVGAA
eukprot:9072276-Pyramimonas_sp.AAC.1